MTVSTTHTINSFTGDGAEDTFTYTFQVIESAQIHAYIDGIEDLNITVVVNADQVANPGGTVTFDSGAPANLAIVEIKRETVIDQLTEYQLGGNFPSESHEQALDKLTMITQENTAADEIAASHVANTSNPHAVTATQVGLGNVDNTSDADKPVSTAQQTALDLKADSSALASHLADSLNPHAVTATQVGLGNVDNTSDVNKPVSIAQQIALNLKYNITDADAKFLHFPDPASPDIASIAIRSSKFLGFDSAGDLAYLVGGGSSTDAALVNIADAGGYYTGVDVEAALQEIGVQHSGSVAYDNQLVLKGSVTAGSPTYALNTAGYTRIDNLVVLSFDIRLSAKGGLAGTLQLSNLPYTVDGTVNKGKTLIEAYILAGAITASDTVNLRPFAGGFDFNYVNPLSAAVSNLIDTDVQNTSIFKGVITYFTADPLP